LTASGTIELGHVFSLPSEMEELRDDLLAHLKKQAELFLFEDRARTRSDQVVVGLVVSVEVKEGS
jgi:hypothetical protein